MKSTKKHGTCCLFGSDPSQISPFHIQEGASPGTAPSLCCTLGGPSKGPDVSRNKAPGCKDLLGREVLCEERRCHLGLNENKILIQLKEKCLNK